jgi:hypothetical protein
MDDDIGKVFTKDNCEKVAQNIFSQLIWSIASDCGNALYRRGIDKEIINSAIYEVMESYLGKGIKLKPAVTVRTTKKGKTDEISIVEQMLNKTNLRSTPNWDWEEYKEGVEYTTDFIFKSKRYPLRNKDGKIIGTIDENDCYELTEDDTSELTKLGITF